ncbi:hypothetical protein DV735_g1652, partial [Chaetothyriales sp. CBS 134920]
MAAPRPIFVLPIPKDPQQVLSATILSSAATTESAAPPPANNFTLTEPSPQIYLLSFTSPPDNRLTPAFLSTFRLALDLILHSTVLSLKKGVLITTSTIPKFYSNGLDFESAVADPDFFPHHLYPLWHRLLTFPMPTVALINGHAFAGGLMTTMMHDYRIMNPDKGFLCVNELEFGAPLPPPMATIFKAKLPTPRSTLRTMVLEARRFPAQDALKNGLIDGVGGLAETLAFATEAKLVQKAQSPSYGLLKEELYKDVVADLTELAAQRAAHEAREDARQKSEEAAHQRVDEWAAITKAKL